MTGVAHRTKQNKLYQWRKANGIEVFTDATPIREHINYLLSLNLTDGMIAAASGCTDSNIQYISTGVTERVSKNLARRILEVTHHPHPAQHYTLAIGAKRRLRALNAIGWPTKHLANRLGITTAALNQSSRRKHITYKRWKQISDLYNELSGTPGPHPETASGRRHPPIPPLAWWGRDIDHPATQPDWTAAGVKLTDRPVCNNGHPWTPENTGRDSRNHKVCLTCRKAADERRRQVRTTHHNHDQQATVDKQHPTM